MYPITSIIILTYNKLEYTKACIQSIRDYTKEGTYEIIVVDNLSSDGTREWLLEQSDIRAILNNENLGFPKGCNQGIEIAEGNSVLLLNNDVLLTKDWLLLLNEALFSSEDIGAVGPVTNSAYGYQEISVSYSSMDEMWSFADTYNQRDSSRWKQRLKLIGYCMLIKRDAIEKVGLLDERFSPGMCEDSDYSFRLLQGGYRMLLCDNVFIHHFGSTSFGEMKDGQKKLLVNNRAKFQEKWGFHTAHSTEIRHDLIQHMDESKHNEAISVLDIGCACGGTLLEIKNRFPHAELHGIERNVKAAAVASRFASVLLQDAEQSFEYPDHYFDYIIIGNVLEQLQNPLLLLERAKRLLKPDGAVLASVYNARHYSVVYRLINGQWRYEDSGPLDVGNLRFFTGQDIRELFEAAGFADDMKLHSVGYAVGKQEEQWIGRLRQLSNGSNSQEYVTYQYIIEARMHNQNGLLRLLLSDIEHNCNQAESLDKLAELTKAGTLDYQNIIEEVERSVNERHLVYNQIAVAFFAQEAYEHIVPLLNASLLLDPHHTDTLYNLSYILYRLGANHEALAFLDRISAQDDHEVLKLRQRIEEQLGG